jgi:hypothetical protein
LSSPPGGQPGRTTQVVRTIEFAPDGGVTLEYVDPDQDVKSNGLMVNHVLWIPYEPYEDEIDKLVDTLRELVAEATRDLATLGPPLMHPSEERSFNTREDDDDDEDGPDFPR